MKLSLDPGSTPPQWVRLGPGVAWLLEQPTASIRFEVSAAAAKIATPELTSSRILELLLAEGAGHRFNLSDQIFAVFTAVGAGLYAGALLRGWRGVANPTTGHPSDHRDTTAIEAALFRASAPGRPALLVPFIGWLNQPDGGMDGDLCRVRDADLEGPTPAFAHKTTSVCWKIVQEVSDGGDLTDFARGLDFARCMAAFERETSATIDLGELGAAFKIFAAIDEARSENTPPQPPLSNDDGVSK